MNKDDLLERKDWEELQQLRDLLEPIYEVSMHVQSVGTTAGALHNTLTSMDYLLHHLETTRAHSSTTHYNACINVSWLKLRKYYQITNLNLAYIIAVFLNPHYCNVWFEEHQDKTFTDIAIVVVDAQYAPKIRTYNTDALEQSSTSLQATYKKELTSFATYNTKKRSYQTFGDKLTKYKNIADPLE